MSFGGSSFGAASFGGGTAEAAVTPAVPATPVPGVLNNCVLSHFLTGTYAVSRPGTGAYSSGRWVPAASSAFTVDACIQPLNGRELQLLPEGFTVSGTKTLYTATLLKAGATAAQSDLVTIGTETWRVIMVQYVEGWDSDGHYKCTIAKVDSP